MSRYFPDVYEASGFPQMVQKYGDYFSYDRCPRARIFQRDHANVTDVDSLTRLMRCVVTRAFVLVGGLSAWWTGRVAVSLSICDE